MADETKAVEMAVVGKDGAEETKESEWKATYNSFKRTLADGIPMMKLSAAGAQEKRTILYSAEGGTQLAWRRPKPGEKGYHMGDSKKAAENLKFSGLRAVKYKQNEGFDSEYFLRLQFDKRNLDFKFEDGQRGSEIYQGFNAILQHQIASGNVPAAQKGRGPKSARGSKDLRSFRPATIKEMNLQRNYKPLTWDYVDKDGKLVEVPIGCGSTFEDLLLIGACYVSIWSALLAMYGLLLRGALDSDESSTFLYMCFFFGLFFVMMVGGAVYTGGLEQAKERAAEAEAALEAEKKKIEEAANA